MGGKKCHAVNTTCFLKSTSGVIKKCDKKFCRMKKEKNLSLKHGTRLALVVARKEANMKITLNRSRVSYAAMAQEG